MPVLILLCALVAGEREPPPPPGNKPAIETDLDLEGWRFAAIPLVSYGSDTGLSLGGALFFYNRIPDAPELRRTFTLSLSYATRGPRAVDATWSTPRLLGSGLRFLVNLHISSDPLMPYWGEGARLGGLSTPPGFGTPPAPYRYQDRRFFGATVLRGPIYRALGWHVRARFLDVGVTEQSQLLAASRPAGARGGRVALGEVGLLFDTRDRETGTRRGVFVTAAGFLAPRLGGFSDFSFHGFDGAARLYLPLWSGGTLAIRGLYDRKIAGLPWPFREAGAVPFFERSLYEGIAYDEGLGGGSTVRGIARLRLSGDEKMLANAQLRVRVLTTHLAGKPQEWGFDAGVDGGRARQPGYDAVTGAGAAVGLRFLWDDAILLRVELGRALRGGENTVYVTFGDQF